MPRPISSTILAALSAPVVYPALFLQIGFASGPIYIWSGLGDKAWGGVTYQGLGSLIEVSSVEESSSVQAKGITITVSGIDPTLLSEALGEFQVGLPVIVSLAVFDLFGNLIGNLIAAFSGRTDKPTITMSGNTATLQIACESRLIDMNIPCERRYTQADQIREYPKDLSFAAVNSIQNVTVHWGSLPHGSTNFLGRM